MASQHARCGIVNVTPLEPGWEDITLKFSNTTPLPAKIYANESVAQFVFIKGNEKPFLMPNEKVNIWNKRVLLFKSVRFL